MTLGRRLRTYGVWLMVIGVVVILWGPFFARGLSTLDWWLTVAAATITN